jgi:hypothetical protein
MTALAGTFTAMRHGEGKMYLESTLRGETDAKRLIACMHGLTSAAGPGRCVQETASHTSSHCIDESPEGIFVA